MLLKTINGARRWRPGAVALTLAAFIPSAIPATASAGTVPPSPFGQYTSSPPGNVFVNNVKAVARTSGHPVFKVKFQFRVGAPGTIRAVNRAQALTQCNGCNAMAIGAEREPGETQANSTPCTASSSTNVAAKDCVTSIGSGCDSRR